MINDNMLTSVQTGKVCISRTRMFSAIDRFCVIFLAIVPLLQHYKGPLFNAGVTVLVALFPILLFRIMQSSVRLYLYDLVSVVPLIVYFIFRIIDHGSDFIKFSHYSLLIFYFVVAAFGCIDLDYFINIATRVAILACALILLQYICYYLLRFHLQLVYTKLLLPEAEHWVLLAKTGLIGIKGIVSKFYRPSAFFLEPSHMFLYIYPIFPLLLFSRIRSKLNLKYALFLSFGLLLSTSGMAIGVLAASWLAYLLLFDRQEKKLKMSRLFTFRSILIILLFLSLFLVLYVSIPFFSQSVDRIIGGRNEGSSAISGRTTRGFNLIRGLSGRELWLGVSESVEGINYNLSGFVATMYKYGLVGLILSYIYYFRSVLVLETSYALVAIVTIVVSIFSAHTHGTFFMLYLVFILLRGYSARMLINKNRVCLEGGTPLT